jgi:hypothetical protein
VRSDMSEQQPHMPVVPVVGRTVVRQFGRPYVYRQYCGQNAVADVLGLCCCSFSCCRACSRSWERCSPAAELAAAATSAATSGPLAHCLRFDAWQPEAAACVARSCPVAFVRGGPEGCSALC